MADRDSELPDPHAEHRERVRTAAAVVIATGVAFAALYFGHPVFVPLALALVFTSLLRPVVRWMERVKIPTPLAATVVVLAALALLAGAVMGISGPVKSWTHDAPQQIQKAREKLGPLGRVLDPVTRAMGNMAGAAAETEGTPQRSGSRQGASRGAPSQQDASQRSTSERDPSQRGAGQNASSAESTQRNPSPGSSGEEGSSGGQGSSGGGGSGGRASVTGKVVGITTGLLTGVLEVLLLTWFLLASGDLFVRKLVHVFPQISEKKRAVEVVRETEGVVSHYMLVSLVMYIIQGTIVSVTAWLVGMPTPVLWGMMTVVLEFIPYLGGTFMMIMLVLVGLATFDSVGPALVTPGAYLAVSTIQNNLASPFAYGRRLRLNPVAVLVGVMVWYAMWGVPGAFLAVPIIATVKVLADRVPGLSALGEFLGE